MTTSTLELPPDLVTRIKQVAAPETFGWNVPDH